MEETIKIHGWIRSIRRLGNLCFIVVWNWNQKIQLTIKRKEVSKELWKLIDELTPESVIVAEGRKTEKKIARDVDLEISPSRIILLSKAHTPLPLDPSEKVSALLPTRLDNRPLDLRNERRHVIFKVYATLIYAFEEWLRKNGFIRVYTPSIIGAPSESGAAVFPVKYFNRTVYLRQDPQLHRQLAIIAGFERLYDIGPSWRAEKSHTTRHLCEYTVCAVEQAFIEDEIDVEKTEENLVKYALRKVKQKHSKELELLGVDIEIPRGSIPELRFPEIYEILKKFNKHIPYGESYDDESERMLGEYVKKEYDSDLFFVNRFPYKDKPFYVMKAEPPWARSVDLLYKGLEISSGGQREHRYEVLMKQIKEKGLDPKNLEWYTKFFKYGAPPHGGFAIGIERMLMKMLNLKNIREAILFPRDPERALP